MSEATIVPYFPSRAVTGHLSIGDFLEALKGFVPLSLRSLSLHVAGQLDFSNVGGMEKAKATLKETILWPSKVHIETSTH